MPNALVTGGTGFIGRHVINQLLIKGWHVRVLLHHKPLLPVPAMQRASSSLEFVYADLSVPIEKNLFHNIDSVIYMAGKGVAAPKNGEPEIIHLLNNMNSSMNSASDLKKFIYLSSTLASAPAKDGSAFTGLEKTTPNTNYGRLKLSEENCLHKNLPSEKVVILRCPPVYGNNGKVNKVLNLLCMIGLYPELKMKLSMISVQDLSRSVVLSLERDISGTYVLSDGYVYTMKNFGIIGIPVQSAANSVINLCDHLSIPFPDALRPMIDGDMICDNKRFQEASGFVSRRHYNYFSRQNHLISPGNE